MTAGVVLLSVLAAATVVAWLFLTLLGLSLLL